jgi:hypothetical protein
MDDAGLKVFEHGIFHEISLLFAERLKILSVLFFGDGKLCFRGDVFRAEAVFGKKSLVIAGFAKVSSTPTTPWNRQSFESTSATAPPRPPFTKCSSLGDDAAAFFRGAIRIPVDGLDRMHVYDPGADAFVCKELCRGRDFCTM